MLIREAADLARIPSAVPLVQSPPSFDGDLVELWDRYIVPNLPEADIVADFHRSLVEYVHHPDTLLLVRQVRGMERGREYTTSDGTRLKATDNAPAWWVHYALHQGGRIPPEAFGRVVATIPTHLFDVSQSMRTSAAAAGWHLAHLFDVKDGRTDFQAWDRADAVARFVRSIHPCNYSLVPKPEWRRWGGDSRVIAFFVARYSERYEGVWQEFLNLARADADVPPSVGSVWYSHAAPTIRPVPTPTDSRHSARNITASAAVVSYRATRLLFKRSVIEPLADGDVFEIMTPAGTFRMTKKEFERTFPRVRATASYRERGVYHFPKVPKAALPFLIGSTLDRP